MLYQDIFVEAMLHMISPIFTELTIGAVVAFGEYDMALLSVLVTLGASVGALILWCAGYGCYLMAKHPSVNFAPEDRHAEMHRRIHTYGIWLLLLVWLPVGFAMAFVAGFFNIPLRIAMPLMIAGIAVYNVVRFLG